ncbi:MAG: pilus assembly PilX N-terminal domain-containing protein, partial [Acidobacteriota bacterium]|nr:pilus assembly PilX N-terminal domain-containing protein [Acidobacteriota bacterium]
MIPKTSHPPARYSSTAKSSERGAALITSILILGMLSAVAITVLAVVQRESQIAGSDLKRTQTFYAAAAGIEKMTTDFSALFFITSRPTGAQLLAIQNSPPPELINIEGYTMNQLIGLDGPTLTAMQASQGITNGSYP